MIKTQFNKEISNAINNNGNIRQIVSYYLNIFFRKHKLDFNKRVEYIKNTTLYMQKIKIEKELNFKNIQSKIKLVINNQLNNIKQESIKDGFLDEEKFYAYWITKDDSRVRLKHEALNGIIFDIRKGASVEHISPGEEVNCRCTYLQATYKTFKEQQKLDNLYDEVKKIYKQRTVNKILYSKANKLFNSHLDKVNIFELVYLLPAIAISLNIGMSEIMFLYLWWLYFNLNGKEKTSKYIDEKEVFYIDRTTKDPTYDTLVFKIAYKYFILNTDYLYKKVSIDILSNNIKEGSILNQTIILSNETINLVYKKVLEEDSKIKIMKIV